jgi:RNA-directed DNA polymerase
MNSHHGSQRIANSSFTPPSMQHRLRYLFAKVRRTMSIYLTHAIRHLAREFPMLAATVRGKTQLTIRIYKYPKSSTARLLGLKSGGSGTLCNFISAYTKITAKFRGPGLTTPVIVIYDNDDGAKSIQNTIKQVSKVRPTGAEPFVHVLKNLYAVPTPVQPSQLQSRIEDLFDAQIRSTIIDGKTFSEQNDFDTATCYGKIVFAHKVIAPNAATIDFTGFHPLLTNIVAAITHHKSHYLPPSNP